MLERFNVSTVTIKLPFRLNHVNCFVGEGESGWTIIDTGLHDAVAHDMWKPIIEEKEISEIIVTHYHPDHYGFAGRLQDMTGAKVLMTKTEYEAALHFAKEERDDILKENYLKCALPEEIVNLMADNETGFINLVTPHPTIDRFFKVGDKIIFGKNEYEILEAPGHADGLVCFYNKEKSVLFSTDHILPKITPNISYHFYGEKNPLKNYLQSLEDYKKLDVEYVIPSHGKPFLNGTKRINEIIQHHHERLSSILDVIKSPSTVYEVNRHLFGENLSFHEMRFAVGETIAHLEYLVHEGECTKEFVNGVYLYRV